MSETESTSRIKVFVSYAHEDKALWKQLDEHLGVLKHEGIIEVWSDHKIVPGEEWNEEILQELETADLILLLVSSAFLSSRYSYCKEMQRAMERHNAGTARVVPIILRPCDWHPAPFGKLQGLPKGMEPVVTASSRYKRAAVWVEVAKGIRQAAEACTANRPPSDPSKRKLTYFHFPFTRNRFFTGRQDTLQVLREVLFGTDLPNVAVITGMDGVGKTQTALEYAYRFRDKYSVIWWIEEAGSVAGLDRGVTKLAEALKLKSTSMVNTESRREEVRRWLERETGWLLILDNADQPKTVRPYLPATPNGHVLITSHNPHWRSMGQPVPLDVWPCEQSVEFLIRRTGYDTESRAAAALAAELGDLPLALEQAAAYVEATRLSFESYLERYREHFTELAGNNAFQPETEAVLTTWEVSLNAATRESSTALDLLRLFAFLASEDISRDLLTAHAVALPHGLAELMTDGVAFDKTVAALVRYSLIKATPDSFAVHRLVQAVTRAYLDNPLPWANAAIALIDAAFPKDSSGECFWPICRRLRPHAEAALKAAEDLHLCTNAISTAALMQGLVGYLCSQGEYEKAEPLLKRALSIQEQALGPKDREVVLGQIRLATVYFALGYYKDGKELFNKALALWKELVITGKTHDPEYRSTVTCLKNLAKFRRSQGRSAEAEELFEWALALFERTFGPDYPDVAAIRDVLSDLKRGS